MKVRKAVIPVAGLGTRFLPVTKVVPKELLPIVNIPTLQLILEEVAESGIEEVLLITNERKRIIEQYFKPNTVLEERLGKDGKVDLLAILKHTENIVKVSFVDQVESLGSAHAIALAREFVGDEPFAVLYGDDLILGAVPALKECIELAEQHDANVIGIQEVERSIVSCYGIISYEDETTRKIKNIVEKPKIEEAPSTSAGLGRYIVKPEIFKKIDELKMGTGNEYQFTDAMLLLMQEQPFYACPFSGTYYDTGSHFGFLKANIAYALMKTDFKESLLNYMLEMIEKEK